MVAFGYLSRRQAVERRIIDVNGKLRSYRFYLKTIATWKIEKKQRTLAFGKTGEAKDFHLSVRNLYLYTFER
jgi:hypothetical protein